jgi:hypothetical protein
MTRRLLPGKKAILAQPVIGHLDLDFLTNSL